MNDDRKSPCRILPLTLENSSQLPREVWECVYWEFDSETGNKIQGQDARFEKEAWLSSVLLQWGTCGQIALQGESETAECIGYVSYAPPSMVARVPEFPTAPVSSDAVLVTYVGITEHCSPDVARNLLLAAVTDLTRRGIRAVEAFGRESDARVESDTQRCVNETEFYLAAGFTTVAPHPVFPRVRLEITGSGMLWRASVEEALAELIEEARVQQLLVTAAV